MGKDLRDIESSWKAQQSRLQPTSHKRVGRLVGWFVLTVCVITIWFAAWAGWGADLGTGLQRLYGIPVAEASVWLRADAHLHALVAGVVTIWAAWGGHLFTRVGSWLGPAVGIMVVIVDEMLQLGAPDRSFEWSDPLAGAFGILLVSMVLLIVARRGRASVRSSVDR